MAAVNSHDGPEESYSMYPKTSSSPLPSQSNMHFPAYQPPVPIYAYPQVPYMYAGQTPAYPFNMMNQNQVMYQGAGANIPQQSNGVGSKKKWNNGNPGTSNNNLSSPKMHHYHPSSPSYHPNSITSSNSTSGSPANKTVSLSSRSDQYKFYAPKADSSRAPAVLPLFFNTTKDEYAKAQRMRHVLRLKSLEVTKEATTHEVKDSFSIPQTVLTAADKESDTVSIQTSNTVNSSQSGTPSSGGSPAPEPAVNLSASPAPSPVVSPDAPVTTKSASKSWSAIASNAVAKPKQLSPGGGNLRTLDLSLTQPSQSPQRKEKKYIPPSTKGAEPLGSIALRMCYDPDFIDYTLKNPTYEKTIFLKSIVPRGIVNRANVCFMSSVLQVLLYCKPFIDVLNVVSTRNLNARVGSSQCKLLDACVCIYRKFDLETFTHEKKTAQRTKSQQNPEAQQQQHQQKTSQQKQQQHQTIISSIADAINPDDFYGALSTIPKFKDLKWGHQEDAEEFLTHLLDQLHEEFISSIDSLTENEIQNLLQSINDEELKIFFIRNLSRYSKAEFIKNASGHLKDLISRYDTITENDEDDGNGWHEVSGTRRGKKIKAAAKRTVEMEPSPMSCLFGGQFRSVLDVPNNKESQSITLDPFQTIQLDISDKGICDLETAFKKFSECEFLPFKSSSGNDVEAKKQTFIDRLPQVLLIQLKRFQFINNTDKNNSMVNYNAYNGRIEKIRKKIKYDHELVIPIESISSASLQRSEDRTYTLTGVIYHHGLSSDGGHYTADVYHKEVDKWYRIDDVSIIELERSDVLKGGEDVADSRTAYILMYQKS